MLVCCCGAETEESTSKTHNPYVQIEYFIRPSKKGKKNDYRTYCISIEQILYHFWFQISIWKKTTFVVPCAAVGFHEINIHFHIGHSPRNEIKTQISKFVEFTWKNAGRLCVWYSNEWGTNQIILISVQCCNLFSSIFIYINSISASNTQPNRLCAVHLCVLVNIFYRPHFSVF